MPEEKVSPDSEPTLPKQQQQREELQRRGRRCCVRRTLMAVAMTLGTVSRFSVIL